MSLDDGVLEVDVRGSGEPVVLIQTALFADEFMPLADHPDLRDGYRVIVYHRRGYAGSTPVRGPGSIVRDADDCRRLLAALGVQRAHVVGGSYAGAVAMQLAVTAPDYVHSLCLVEPPPVHTAHSSDEFRRVSEELVEDYRLHGSSMALDRFLVFLMGDSWREELDGLLPHGVAHAERDAGTFFGSDLPALLSWSFGAEEARRIGQPVLYVGGTDSGPWFAEVRQLVRAWLPQAEDVVVEGADHSLALTHTEQLATAVADFLRRHPLDA